MNPGGLAGMAAGFGGAGSSATPSIEQRGVITIPSLALSATATISSVNTSKTKVRFLGTRGADNSGVSGGSLATVVLTNSTTITAQRDVAAGFPCSVSWELTEELG